MALPLSYRGHYVVDMERSVDDDWDRQMAGWNWVTLVEIGGGPKADKSLSAAGGAKHLIELGLATRANKITAITDLGRGVLERYRPDPVSGQIGQDGRN